MNPIGAIRSFTPIDLTALNAVEMKGSNGPGGITSQQFEALAAAIENPAASSAAAPKESDFSNLLGQMVQEVQSKQAAADSAMTGVLAGDGVPLHEAVMASEEASLSFQLMVEVRNKLLESYQELMRMQV